MGQMKFNAKIAPDNVLDGLTTAVVCLDSNMSVVYMNASAEALFRVGARQAINQRVDEAFPALGPQYASLVSAYEEAAPFTIREFHLSQNGHSATVDLTVTLRVEGRGLLLEFMPMDRHLRISRDDHIAVQQQYSREMIRGLAHEIKNPLGGVRGAAQLLEKELSDDSLREYTGIIISESDRLKTLVDRLLGPNKPLQKITTNLHEPLEHVRQLLAADLPDGVQMLRDYDPSIPDVEVDPEQLIQILLNITANAIQMVGEQGCITLRTRAQRHVTLYGTQYKLVARIDIIDDGPGVAADMQEAIFYPMVSTRADGSGLGLPIAQHLARCHGGLIECSSQPGETVFSLFLPLEMAPDNHE